jgi:hypothetical protein
MVAWLDANKGAFCISRLIMQTGIKLRSYDAATIDEPRVLAKLWPAVEAMLTPAERDQLLEALRDSG